MSACHKGTNQNNTLFALGCSVWHCRFTLVRKRLDILGFVDSIKRVWCELLHAKFVKNTLPQLCDCHWYKWGAVQRNSLFCSGMFCKLLIRGSKTQAYIGTKYHTNSLDTWHTNDLYLWEYFTLCQFDGIPALHSEFQLNLMQNMHLVKKADGNELKWNVCGQTLKMKSLCLKVYCIITPKTEQQFITKPHPHPPFSQSWQKSFVVHSNSVTSLKACAKCKSYS